MNVYKALMAKKTVIHLYRGRLCGHKKEQVGALPIGLKEAEKGI